jgi:acetyl-CoA carboxylase carboxyl transferase subunit alpha
MEYLDFELPIRRTRRSVRKCIVIGKESDVDVTKCG